MSSEAGQVYVETRVAEKEAGMPALSLASSRAHRPSLRSLCNLYEKHRGNLESPHSREEGHLTDTSVYIADLYLLSSSFPLDSKIQI